METREPPTCILTGAPGENADDCTTHDHEPMTTAQSQSPAQELHECIGASLTVLVDQVTLANHHAITEVVGWLQRARELAAVMVADEEARSDGD